MPHWANQIGQPVKVIGEGLERSDRFSYRDPGRLPRPCRAAPISIAAAAG
jgi:hypothetical protein